MDTERTARLAQRAGRVARMLATIVLATTIAVPLVAWAGHQFTDVPAAGTFHADIDWLADTGVTKGCNPPTNSRFCPGDFVTREQMAAFMHRLETEGVFLPTDGTAADAHLLDGKDSTAFLGVNDTAADADQLDGLDSTSYARIEEVAELGTQLQAFSPIATISVRDANTTGTTTTSHRRPVAGPPTFMRIVDGEYRVDFGITLTYDKHIASCTGILQPVFVTYELKNGFLYVSLWDSGTGALATGTSDDFVCFLYNS